MRIELENNSIDLEQPLLKTLLAIWENQNRKQSITPQLIMLTIFFEKSIHLETPNISFHIRIDELEKKIFEHLKILKMHNLIEGTDAFTIPEKHFLLLQKIKQEIPTYFDRPFDPISVYEKIIPQIRNYSGLYSPYNDSFLSMYNGLGYAPQGLFIKLLINGDYYTALIRIDSELPKIYEDISNWKYSLERIGIKTIILEKIPIKPIQMFPIFTEAYEIIRDLEKEQKKKKIDFTLENPKNYLEKWFYDYLNARRELTDKIDRFTLVDPFLNTPLHIILFLNDKLDSLATYYYVSENINKVDVRLVEKVPFDKEIESMSDLPPRENLLRSRNQYSKDFLPTLGHPFTSAIKDIGKQIQEFNKKAREPLFDTNEITDKLFQTWIKQEIDARRYLLNRLEVKDEYLNKWLNPLTVYVTYSLDEQRPNLRRSGHYLLQYKISKDADQIIVERIEKKTEGPKFNVDNQEFFYIQSGDLLSFMMKTRGEYYRSYF